MGLAQPEEADMDAARCRGYLIGLDHGRRLAQANVRALRVAAGNALPLAQRACAWSIVESLKAALAAFAQLEEKEETNNV